MTEQNHEYYVSLEVAKLLKEAGFDWKQYSFYNSKGVLINGTFAANWNDKIWDIDGSKVSAPTLDVAQRWLREVKGVYLDIDTHFNSAGVWFSYVINILDSDAKFGTYSNCLGVGHSFNEHKEAQEAGIKKALEIIVKKGE